MTTHFIELARSGRGAVLPPTMRTVVDWSGSRPRRFIIRLGALLAVAGLVTISWERLADLHVSTYNVKLPSVFFTLAVICLAPALPEALRRLRRRDVVAVFGAAVLVVTFYSLRALFEPDAHGLAQIVAIATGAVAPAVAVFAVVHDRDDLVWILGWFIRGGYLAAAFGLYQLMAFYLHWPQFVVYQGVAVGGTVGRIAAFNYEPAYFAYYLVLVVGALLMRARLSGNRFPWAPMVLVGVALAFADVRALLFIIPALVVLLAISWRANSGFVLRLGVLGVLLLACVGWGDWAIKAASAPASPEVPNSVQSAARPASIAPSSVPSASPSATSRGPANIFDPHEATSNAPRLAMYRAVVELDLAHPIIGVGPGRLGEALQGSRYVRVKADSTVVANNIWLQAGADGGMPLLALEIALVVAALVLLVRHLRSPIQPLFVAWVSVIAVAGMLTSYFFDAKLWAVLGILVAAAVTLRPEESAVATSLPRDSARA